MFVLDHKTVNSGLQNDNDWKSDHHKNIAIHVSLFNPLITELNHLIELVNIINDIPHDRIEGITFGELKQLGCPGIL